MAIQSIGSSTALVPVSLPRLPASGAVATTDQASASAASTSSTADASTIVSEATTTNADGSVTTVITYKDGHTQTTTSPATVANPAGRLLAGDLRSTNNNVGRLLNILV